MLILTNRHHFLTTFFSDVLNVNANRTKLLFSYSKKCLNHVFVLEQLKSYLVGKKSHARTVAWSHHMERHAQSCFERYFELVNIKTEQVYIVSSLCLCFGNTCNVAAQLYILHSVTVDLTFISHQDVLGPSRITRKQLVSSIVHSALVAPPSLAW